MRKPLAALAVVALIAASAVAAVLWARPHRPEALRADNAVGDAACLSCHSQMLNFKQTAHHLTSRLPDRGAIAGSFTAGENVMRTANPKLYFRMDSTATGFYETAVEGRPPDTTSRSERIAIVTGSRKGQSFLYWGPGDALYQLPVSYWEGQGWVNSPGYPDGQPNFGRPIPPRCLECHASWFAVERSTSGNNHYQPTTAILGIGCETCHGAGREHVRNEGSPLHWLLPFAIVNPRRLPRTLQMDGCALCHSGAAPLRSAPFSYVPGLPLERANVLLVGSAGAPIDVHGNQVGALQRSKCFLSSQMTCATCHDVHQEQRDVVAFSGRCLTCHTIQSLSLVPRHGPQLEGRCVDCHMPLQTSAVIRSTQGSRELRVQVRTHWIKVYPVDTIVSRSY